MNKFHDLIDGIRLYTKNLEYNIILKLIEEASNVLFDNPNSSWIVTRELSDKIIKNIEKFKEEEKKLFFDELKSLYSLIPQTYSYETEDFGDPTEGTADDLLENDLIMTMAVFSEYFSRLYLPYNDIYLPFNLAINRIMSQIAVLTIHSTEEEMKNFLAKTADIMFDKGIRVKNEEGKLQRFSSSVCTAIHEDIVDYVEVSVREDMKRLNTPYVEVSAHMTARPTHKVWQGKIYYWSRHGEEDPSGFAPDFIKNTQYGEMLGLLGINCYHIFRAYDPGTMRPTYTEKQLEKINTGTFKHKYNGKVFETNSEIRSYKHYLENRMDILENKIKARNRIFASPSYSHLLKMKFRRTRDEYIDFTRSFNAITKTKYLNKSI